MMGLHWYIYENDSYFSWFFKALVEQTKRVCDIFILEGNNQIAEFFLLMDFFHVFL